MIYHYLNLVKIKDSDFCLQVELVINLNESSATVDAVIFPVTVPRSTTFSLTCSIKKVNYNHPVL